jgi:hypothetical protein
MNISGETRLRLVIDENQLHNLFLILQSGFFLKIQVGCSLMTFLIGEIGLSPEFIEEKIQTIFLDGQVVDDLDSAIIKDGSSLALSSAMPGLVGAAMRRGGGFYGALRSSITYREKGKPDMLHEGTVHIRLYNLLMKELGALFLMKDIYMSSSDLAGFLSNQPESFWIGCKGISLDNKPLSMDALLKGKGLSQHKMTYLTVRTEP